MYELGYKGTDMEMKCQGKQYVTGEWAREPLAKLCKRGGHFCLYPLDVFSYYPPATSRYFEIEADEVSEETRPEDSKRVCKSLRIKAEIGIKGLIDAAIKFTFDRAIWSTSDKASGTRGAAQASGYQGAAQASGYQGAAQASGYQGAAQASGTRGAAQASGDQGAAAATGQQGIASGLGYRCKAKGALTCWIVLAERDDDGNILTVKTAPVDGETIKADTYYVLVDGEFVEA